MKGVTPSIFPAWYKDLDVLIVTCHVHDVRMYIYMHTYFLNIYVYVANACCQKPLVQCCCGGSPHIWRQILGSSGGKNCDYMPELRNDFHNLPPEAKG
jgi:hypothetical protein